MKKPKASILVVEDDPAILNGLLDVLVFNGYEATGLEDGGQGLEASLEENYDLIILDVMLPTLDGFSICRTVRKKRPGQGIIILTAKGSEDDVVTGFKAGDAMAIVIGTILFALMLWLHPRLIGVSVL